jgi:N-acetylglucosaminyldiphosphoundecaprenol N-acetyl-beta-D-mannosaminyltransferase
MIDLGKKNVLGVMVDAVDYNAAVDRIIRAAEEGRPYAVSALAVHGVMTGVDDAEHRYRLNHLDLVTPDGQPVRWALNLLHKTGLRDRVYGPNLTLRVMEAAADRGLPVFFYGSRPEVLERLVTNMTERFPNLKVAGAEPSKFRTVTGEEKLEIAERITASGARVTFVGLGCPRQEVFAYEYRALLSMPLLAVGAAFDYHAGLVDEPPAWMQRSGLQWLYRLGQDPRRLWRRYLILNPRYLGRLALQWIAGPSNAATGQKPDSTIALGV